jgi:hypothetical protein
MIGEYDLLHHQVHAGGSISYTRITGIVYRLAAGPAAEREEANHSRRSRETRQGAPEITARIRNRAGNVIGLDEQRA